MVRVFTTEVRGTVGPLSVESLNEDWVSCQCYAGMMQFLPFLKKYLVSQLLFYRKWEQAVTAGSLGFKNPWMSSVPVCPCAGFGTPCQAPLVSHQGACGSQKLFALWHFAFFSLCTGGYDYPSPPPYSYRETTTIEEPGKPRALLLKHSGAACQQKGNGLSFIISREDGTSLTQSQSDKVENFHRNVRR